MPGAAARILVAAAVPGKNSTVVWYYIRNCTLLQSDPRSINGLIFCQVSLQEPQVSQEPQPQ